MQDAAPTVKVTPTTDDKGRPRTETMSEHAMLAELIVTVRDLQDTVVDLLDSPMGKMMTNGRNPLASMFPGMG